MRAWELHQQGWTNVAIATALGVSKVAVGQWIAAAEAGGTAALARKSRHGQAALLSAAQVAQLPGLLDVGPEAYGFVGSFWTAGRVAWVIEKTFGVGYSPRHVNRLLRALNWTYHKPLVRASQRDAIAIETWLHETWPALKKASEIEGRTIVFLDEAAFYMGPTVAKTWAPAGTEIELKGPLKWAHLSVIGGLTWDGRLFVQAQPTSLKSAGVIRFLEYLLQNISGRILILWDGARIHNSKETKAFLELDREQRIAHAKFPPYAPEVDPQEYVWHQLKHVYFRNLTSRSLDQLSLRLQDATARLRRRVGILKNFIKHAGLE